MATNPGAALFHATAGKSPTVSQVTPTPSKSPGAALFHTVSPAGPSHAGLSVGSGTASTNAKTTGSLLGTLEKVGKTAADVTTLGTSGAVIGGGYLPDVVGPVAHVAAKTGEGLATDAYNVPGGLYHATAGLGQDTQALAAKLGLHSDHTDAALKADPSGYGNLKALGKAQLTSIIQSAEHPLRRPDLTLLNALALAAPVARLGAAGTAAVDVARGGGTVGDIAKALVRKPAVAPRLLQARPAAAGGEPTMVPLVASHNLFVRHAIQKPLDAAMQHALLHNPDSNLSLRRGSGNFGLGGIAASKVGRSLEETAARRSAMAAAPGQRLEVEGAKIGGIVRGTRGVSKIRAWLGSSAPARTVQQAALRLTAEGRTPEEALATHTGALKAIRGHTAALRGAATPAETAAHRSALDELGDAADHTKQINLLNQVKAKGLVTRAPDGSVVIDASKSARLANLDSLLATAGDITKETLAKLDEGNASAAHLDRTGKLVTPTDKEAAARLAQIQAGRQARIDAPNRVHAGATYENPTPGKLGTESPTTAAKARRVASLQRRYDQVAAQVKGSAAKTAGPNDAVIGSKIVGPGRVVGANGAERLSRLGGALSVAKDELERARAADANRVKPTGLLGGGGARPGRQYVPYYATEPKGSSAAVSRAPSEIVGKAQDPVGKHPFTGASIHAGRVPDNTTGLVARHLNRLVKKLMTDEFRRGLPGSPTRLTKEDRLVNTQDLTNATVPDDLKAAMGGKRVTLDELAGAHDAFEAFRQQIVPILDPGHADDGLPHDAPIGTPAPTGYKWVHRKMMGELGRAQIPLPGRFVRLVDRANSAQTAATVYYKLGHVATRGVTNLVTNAIEGSLSPVAMQRAYRVWTELSPAERDQAHAGVGSGGFGSIPQEGVGPIGRIAKAGAHFWARRFDAPSRFLNLHYIASKEGFGATEAFRGFLKDSADPSKLNAVEAAKVDGVWKRADRASIQYGNLSDFEKRYLSRAIWFWPWVKGSTRFAGRTLVEHPVKSLVGGNLGSQQAQQVLKDLGPQPSYNAGLFKVGGSSALPEVANFNTMSPFSTPAQLAESLIHLNKPTQAEQLSSMLTPALAALGDTAYHVNSFGSASKTGTLKNAAEGALGSTPEDAFIKALMATPQNQARKMFPTDTWGGVLKFLFGSAVPRRENRYVANTAARAEKTAAGR